MKLTLRDCNNLYKFFNKDFFKAEFGYSLGRCHIFTDKKEAEELFGPDDYDVISGVSWIKDGKNLIWLNSGLLNNKKLLCNTLLHEMIHLYDFAVNGDVRKYREGHGSWWTKVANYATELYGDHIGKIDRFGDYHERERLDHYNLMRKTKTLSNVYIVVLRTRDLVPVKELTDKQIEWLKGTNIRGIFRVKPNIEQSGKTRVKKYATFDMLKDDIADGISWEEEQMYNDLNLKLGENSEPVWINPKKD